MKKRTLAILVPSGALAAILLVIFASALLKTGRQQGMLLSKASTQPRPATQEYVQYNLAGDYSVPESTVAGAYYGGKQQLRSTEQLDLAYEKQAMAEQVYSPPLPSPAQTEGTIIVIQPILPATGEGEKIIRNAEVKLEVEDGTETYKDASQICKEMGGYLASSNFYKDESGRQAGIITMRIPKDKFTAALDKLATLGKVENISTASQDVSQEYANLKAQLDAEMIIYKKMLEALEKRQTTIPEAVRLGNELAPVLRRIEGLKNKIEYLNNSVAFTTINVYFHESQVSMKTLKESGRFIQEGLITAGVNAVKFLASAIPVVILGIILLVAAILAALAIKYLITRRR